MSNLRSGTFGEYYGSYYGESSALTWTQMEKNAEYIFSYLTHEGWTAEAIAGLLGNLHHESSINPGRWQNDNVGGGPAYGIVQWDPWTKYVNWCTEQGFADPSEMDNALARIIYELENGLQYIPTSSYPLTFNAFTESRESPYYLACAFAWNYERSWVVLYGSEEEKAALRKLRGESAETWYSYLTGLDPKPPPWFPGGGGSGTTKKRTGYNFVLFGKRRRFIHG